MSNNNNSDDYSGEVKKGSSSSSSHLGGGVQQDLKPHLAAIQQGNVPQGGSAGLTTDSIYFWWHFSMMRLICRVQINDHSLEPSNSLVSKPLKGF